MKTPLHILAALAALTLTTAADTPDAILKDYRTRATQATQRLNETLEKQATPLIAALVGKGDTAGAEALTAQVKAKLAGEPVAAPHVSAATLFAQYDGARATALKPVQSAGIARLDSLLKTAGGPKIDDLAAITKAKAEIEAGKIANSFDWKRSWVIHNEKNSPANGKVMFKADGSALYVSKVGNKSAGTWEESPKANSIKVLFPQDEWLVTSKHTGVEFQSKSMPKVAYLTPEE